MKLRLKQNIALQFIQFRIEFTISRTIKWLLLGIALMSHVFFVAQNNDTYYLKKLDEFRISNNDSLIYYANKLKSTTNDCHKYRAIMYEAKAYYQLGDLNRSENICQTLLADLKERNEHCFKVEKLAALHRLFWIYKNQRFYDKAYQVALERKVLSQSFSDDAFYQAKITSVNYNLAIIKNIMGFHEEAREILKTNFSKLPEIFNNLKEEQFLTNEDKSSYLLKRNRSSISNIIGESYLNSSTSSSDVHLDSASHYFKKAYLIAKTFIPPHEDSETLYQLREAEVLIARKEFEASLFKINNYSKNADKFDTEQRINALKAICFHNLNKHDSAIFYSEAFLKNYDHQKNNREKLIAIYDILSNRYYKIKQLDSAYKYSELTISELNDFNENKNSVNKAHYLHNYNDIKILNGNIIKKESNKQMYIILFSVIGMTILIYLVFLFQQKKKKAEMKLNVIKNQVGDISSTEKTDYNIDDKTEKNILNGIKAFERNKDFTQPDFTINKLAKKLDTNTTYLSFVFNKNYKQSFKQYLTHLRIEFVVSELDKNYKLRNYSVKAIAAEIGYTSASSFTRAFKKHKGITPSDYIKSLTN